MTTDWVSFKVFESDLWCFSEIETPASRDEEVATPANILEYNARVGANNNRSIFETPNPTDDVTFVFSGRGRGVRSTMIRPGSMPLPSTDVHSDVRRRLREVSGLGYSNELIEQSFKAATGTTTGTSTSDIKLQPVPSTSSASSSRSTSSRRSNVQTLVSPKRSSPSGTTASRSTASNLSGSSCSSRSTTPPNVAEMEPVDSVEEASGTTAHPLPLSVMLNRAKQDMMKAKENTNKALEENGGLEAKENIETDQNSSTELNVEAAEWYPNGNHVDNDYWWNRELRAGGDEPNSWRGTNSPNRFFVWNKNKSFNISSSKEFPALQ